MIALALDTALAAASVAVVDGARTLAAASVPMERGHQERLGGLVRAAVAEAGIGFAALDRIGVTTGPGSFTGLRVGLAFAKALALALDRPCVGIGALQALAMSVEAPGLLASVIDARRGQVYLQLFHGAGALTEPQALTAAEAAARAAEHADGKGGQARPILLVGSGAALLRQASPALRDAAIHPRLWPDPVALARLTLIAPEPIPRPQPLYLRPPDARTIAERAAG